MTATAPEGPGQAVPCATSAGRGASDDALATAMQHGDTGALGALYDRHAAGLRRFAARATTASEADDIVQAVFLRAATRVETFDPTRGTARAWLHGIAARVLQEWHRSLVRRARALIRATPSPETAPGVGSRTDVARALAALTEQKRVVVILSEIEGFTGEEIAEMLGVPVGTVWTRLHHARKELRARLVPPA